MASIITRLLLFLSSYFPLSLIFFFLFAAKHRWASLIILLVGVIGFSGMVVYLQKANTIAPLPVKVVGVQRCDGEAISYIVSYIIPFLAVPFSSWEQGIALSIFFLVIGFLYVNSNLIHINPMLNLIGYHVYEITLEDGGVCFVITRRRRIKRGDILLINIIAEHILLEKIL